MEFSYPVDKCHLCGKTLSNGLCPTKLEYSQHYYCVYYCDINDVSMMFIDNNMSYSFLFNENSTEYRIHKRAVGANSGKFIKNAMVPGVILVTTDNYLQVIDRMDNLQAFK